MSVIRADYRKDFALGCERILEYQVLPTTEDANIRRENEALLERQELQDPDCYSILLRLQQECEKVDKVAGLARYDEQHSLSIPDQIIQFYSTNPSQWATCFTELLKEDIQGIIPQIHEATGHFALVDIMKECLDDLKGFFSRMGKAGILIRHGIATRKGALEHVRNQTRRLRVLGENDHVSINDLRRAARLQMNATTRMGMMQSQPDIEVRQRHTFYELPLLDPSAQPDRSESSAIPHRSTELLPNYDRLQMGDQQANNRPSSRTVDQEQYDNESHVLRKRSFNRITRRVLRLSRLLYSKVWVPSRLPTTRTTLLCCAAIVSSSFCAAFACMEQGGSADSQQNNVYNSASQAILNILPAAIAISNFIKRTRTQRDRLASSNWIIICTMAGALSAVVSLLLTRKYPVTSSIFSYLANLFPMLSNFRIFTFTDDL